MSMHKKQKENIFNIRHGMCKGKKEEEEKHTGHRHDGSTFSQARLSEYQLESKNEPLRKRKS